LWREERIFRKHVPRRVPGDAATFLPSVNHAVYRAADARDSSCNAVDDIRELPFSITVPWLPAPRSANCNLDKREEPGAGATAAHKEHQAQSGAEYENWLGWLALRATRCGRWRFFAPEQRSAAATLRAGKVASDFAGIQRKATTEASNNGKSFSSWSRTGRSELLTLSRPLLQQADVVLSRFRSLAGSFATCFPTAELVTLKARRLECSTQDEINSLLVAYAVATNRSFKNGEAGIRCFSDAPPGNRSAPPREVFFEVVPASRRPLCRAAAGFFLSRSPRCIAVLFTTFSRGASVKSCWARSTSDTTLAIYMPGVDYVRSCCPLVDAGLDPEIPCAIISHANAARTTDLLDQHRCALQRTEIAGARRCDVGKVATQAVQEIGEPSCGGQFSESDNLNIPVHSWVKN